MYNPIEDVKVSIYKPRYTVGDIVYIANRNNKGGIYLKIQDCVIEFSRFDVINGVVRMPCIVFSAYSGQIMPGSHYDVKTIPEGKALVGYFSMDIVDVDGRSEFVGRKKNDYVLFDNNTPKAIIDVIENNLVKQAIETIELLKLEEAVIVEDQDVWT